MKRKDIVMLGLSAVIFTAAGVLGYKQLATKQGSSKEVKVEVVTPIRTEFDQEALKALSDPNKVRNFTPPVDLTNGLGNTKPFNAL